jgi:aspartyl-tRNA(Asn)/glutamyl-tRNA(Gln) amidotransferase subunit A
MKLASHTIKELQGLLEKKEIQPNDIIDSVAEAKEARDERIGGYLSMDVDHAKQAAANTEASGPLAGIPIATKDLISVDGLPCGCASKILEGYTAPYDASAIKCLKDSGGIVLGRTNMDEFAMGSSNENSSVKPVHNPWDLERIPGGSSGGSAAVVAADEAIAALGSDTGGSIRQPAALCGCVGLKPSYGRVSRFGLVAYASSLDQIGPMTKTVEDAAILLGAISGGDPNDTTCLDEPVPDYTATLNDSIKGMKLGLPREYFGEGMDASVREAVEAAAKHYETLGAEIVEVSMPHTEQAVGAYYIIATAEASANLARFDAVRYGHRSPTATNLAEQYAKSRAEGFGDEVKLRILLGTYVLSSGYYDAYYVRAQKLRTLIRKDFTQAFEKVDALITPTTPSPAFKIGEKTSNPLEMYLADIYTISANLAGLCGISLPCGFAKPTDGGTNELPIGLQILGAPFAESTILRAAHQYERATDWHKRRPAFAS